MPLFISSPQQATLRSCRSSVLRGRCSYNSKTSRRGIHHVPKLSHDEHFREHGVGRMLSRAGYDIAWTQYQGYLVDQLNRMTACTIPAPTNRELYFSLNFHATNFFPSATSFPSTIPSPTKLKLTLPPIHPATKEADRPTRDLLLTHARLPASAALFNHASMAWNSHHTMTTLSPNPTPLSTRLSSQITRSFSSPDSFKKTFIATANAMFGPGFVWLLKSNTVRAGNMANDPQLSILCTYIAGSPLPGAHYRRQDIDMNTQNADSLTDVKSSMTRAGSFGSSSGSLDSRIGFGGSSHEVMLGVCTWQHFWLRDWGVGGKKDYLEAWWDSVDWDVVEKNGCFDDPTLKRAGQGLPGGWGRNFRKG